MHLSFRKPSSRSSRSHRRDPFKPLLECLEPRINPNVFNDLSQFSEGGVLFSEITVPEPQPPARRDHAATAVDNKLIIHGGVDANGTVLSDLWEFDPASKTWTQLPQNGSAPGASFNHTLIPLNANQVGLFGGPIVPILFVYDRTTNTWTTATTFLLGGPRLGHNAFVHNNTPFIFAGKNLDGVKSNALFFKSGPEWFSATTQGTQPVPRSDAASEKVMVDGDNDSEIENWVFFFGGNGSELNDTFGLNLQTFTWVRFADMPTALIGAQAAAFDDNGVTRILVFGGTSGGVATASTFLFTPDTNTWEIVTLGAPNPGPRDGHTLTTVNGVPILFGGDGPGVVPPGPGPDPGPTPPKGSPIFVVGADAGGLPEVKVFDATTGALKFHFLAYDAGFRGGVRVAVGDVNGDGTDDIITGAGPGGGPQVRVFDGLTGQPLAGTLGSFFGISPSSFSGGVFVAAGDVDGDGRADIIVGADAGGGPQVNVFSGRTGAVLHTFNALPATFSGGVRVGAGDTDGDGRADIIIGAGPGALPQVTVFRGTDLATLQSFWAFPLSFAGGVYVAGDDLGNIVVGAGPGGLPQVSVFDGRTAAALRSFFAYEVLPVEPVAVGQPGVRVGAATVNAQGRLLAAPGPGSLSQIRVFDDATLSLLDSFFAFGDTFLGGAFVAG